MTTSVDNMGFRRSVVLLAFLTTTMLLVLKCRRNGVALDSAPSLSSAAFGPLPSYSTKSSVAPSSLSSSPFSASVAPSSPSSSSTSASVAPSSPSVSPSASAAPPSSSSPIPVVYVYFNGEPERRTGSQCPAVWSASRTKCPNDYFITSVGVTASQGLDVVLITDLAYVQCFQDKFPANVFSKITFADYLCHTDGDYWAFNDWYNSAMKQGVRALKEPWEKLNHLSFYVLHSWVKKTGIDYLAYAEGDVVVLASPVLPSGCDSIGAWDARTNSNPLYWAGMWSLGQIMRRNVLSDYINFMSVMFNSSSFVQMAIYKSSRAPFWSQMALAYLYAMASKDRAGTPWLQVPKEQGGLGNGLSWPKEHTTENWALPSTGGYRICNGFYPIDGRVHDNMHMFLGRGAPVFTWSNGTKNFTMDSVGGKVQAHMDGMLVQNLHFQGQQKGAAKDLFKKFLVWGTTSTTSPTTTTIPPTTTTVPIAASASPKYDRIVVVMHSGAPGRDHMIDFSVRTWLKGIKTIVVTRPDLHDPARNYFGIAAFNGTPGTDFVFHLKGQTYWGANRLLHGIQIANATYNGQFDWVFCIDDDNFVSFRTLWQGLQALDPSEPLFIASLQGFAPCQSSQSNENRPDKFHCCGNLHACKVNRSSTELQTYKSGRVHSCSQYSDMAKNHPYICCPVVPATGSMKHAGFPYQYSPDGVPYISGTEIWPYGGAGYLLSRALLSSISVGAWTECIDKLVCGNGDQMVGNCLFHNGFTYSSAPWHVLAMKHHVRDTKTMQEMIDQDALGKWPWTTTGIG